MNAEKLCKKNYLCVSVKANLARYNMHTKNTKDCEDTDGYRDEEDYNQRLLKRLVRNS